MPFPGSRWAAIEDFRAAIQRVREMGQSTCTESEKEAITAELRRARGVLISEFGFSLTNLCEVIDDEV